MDRGKIIVRTSLLGIVVNAAMVALKMTVGLFSGSIAILLDAVNNFSDGLSSIITIVGTKLSERAPDKKFPYGHGRIEYMTTVIISFIIIIAGGTSVKESIENIINHETATYTAISIFLIAVAVVVKFFSGRHIKHIGEQIQSKSLVASGREALFDCILSLATLAAAAVNLLFGLSIEGWIGIVISILIIKAGAEMLGETMGAIIGRRVDKDITVTLRNLIRSFSEVKGAYDIVLHNYGPARHMGSVHIEVDEKLNAKEIHILTQRIMAKVYKEMGIMITVGIYSGNDTDPISLAMRKDVAAITGEYKEVLQMHGFYLDGNTVGFDIVVEFKADANAVRKEIASRLKALHPDLEFRIVIDLDFSD